MKRVIFKPVVCTAMAFFAIACCSQPQSPAERLMAVIEAGIDSGVIMFGHQDATVYGHSWEYESDRSDTKDITGEHPAVMGWDLGGIELGDSLNLDGVPFRLIREEIAKQHARGGINTFSWHTFNPYGGKSWKNEAGVVTSILEGGENYDMFQERLNIVADYLGSLRDERGDLIPVIFRPWHEHDGNWFWWGDKWCTHEEYRQLWDMTYKFMSAKGLNNLVWAYMPMRKLEDKTPSIEQFDLVGFDSYHRKHSAEEFTQLVKDNIEEMKYFGDKYNKVIAITEIGYESVPMSDWWTQVLLPAMKDQPISYVLMWRNAYKKPDHFFSAYKGHSSEADFKRMIDEEDIILVDESKHLWK